MPIQNTHRLSTWSLTLGITSIILPILNFLINKDPGDASETQFIYDFLNGLTYFVSFIAAIIAITFGIIARLNHHPGKKKAILGIITGSILPAVFIVFCFIIMVTGIQNATNGTDYSEQSPQSTRGDTIHRA